ncbi:hypothetical protein CVT26_002880, partial [Gymnopilus dilepis]
RSYFNSVTRLPSIAVELQDEIVSYLPSRDARSVMQTCKGLWYPAIRHLYSDVALSELRARKFFRTISETGQPYPDLVKSLHYVIRETGDVYLTYVIFCQALLRMQNLKALTITVPPTLSPLLLFHLRRNSIIRPRCGPFPVILPRLRMLNVNGDFKISALTLLRDIVSLSLTEVLDGESFKSFLNATKDQVGLKTNLQRLIITLHPTAGSRISAAMVLLDSNFPSLIALTIRTPTVNALEASAILASTPAIFLKLCAFSLNDWSILEPVFVMRESDAIARQRGHVLTCRRMREGLQSLTFRSLKWNKSSDHSGWFNHHVLDQDLEGSLVSEERASYPLFWEVVYRDAAPFTAADREEVLKPLLT